MSKLTYASAERFILSREFFGMKLGLENISRFLASIGSPQLRYRTVHIAGTNGKGSTAAMIASVLQAAGYKTGLFTSPHLVSLRERVRVNGRVIPQQSVVAFISRHKKELSKWKLSFFELITAMAFYHFAQAGIDIAVIETGLGGRLDATNVLSPELTITTDISLDHMEILGTTLGKIAREKAGIIHPDTPHLAGLLAKEADAVIAEQCRRRGAPYYRLRKRDFQPDLRTLAFSYAENGHRWTNLKPALVGPHQLYNAALAVKALIILRQKGLRIAGKHIAEGLAQTRWRGRFEIIARRGKPTLILDVGHNAAGVEAFVSSFQNRFPGRSATILTGFVKRKEHQKMFDSMSRIAERYALVPLKTRRSVNLNELIAQVNWRGVPYRKYGSLQSAYRRVVELSTKDDIIVIAGSHYLVGEFMAKYLSRSYGRNA